MLKLTTSIKTIAVSLVVIVQTISMPALYLSSVNIAPVSAATVCPSVTGTTRPTGSAAHTYQWNADDCLWQNKYYEWSPVTKITTATYDQTPTLNKEGTAVEYDNWEYSPAAGKYENRRVSTPVQTPQTLSPEKAAAGNVPSASPGIPASSVAVGAKTVNGTGSSSNNAINSNNQNDMDIGINNSTTVNSVLNSTANSGNAYVLSNTNGGSATTGDASVVANHINMIQSGWNPENSGISSFNADIIGNNYGDLMFNPDAILNSGPSSTNNITSTNDNNLNINVKDNVDIVNDINLDVKSGDATVSRNTNAGDVTTGDATAVANLINMINSSISAGQSFMGNINILGSLDGDLLLPPGLMAMLSNTGANSNNNISNNNTNNTILNSERNIDIANNFNLNAQSGEANVSSNTNAGSALTGSAATNVQQQNIIGANTTTPYGLLVVINGLARWTGIYNPNFAHISDTGYGSNNDINNTNSNDINIANIQNYSITNNINASAKSGDATLTNNTNAGNARTGNANVSANILNVIDSNLNFSDWFGVLFINVFGDWNGSFGIDTVAGGMATISGTSTAKTSTPTPAIGGGQVPTAGYPLVGYSETKDDNNIAAGTIYGSSGTLSGTQSAKVASVSRDASAVASATSSPNEDTSAQNDNAVINMANDSGFRLATLTVPALAILLGLIYINRGFLLSKVSR